MVGLSGTGDALRERMSRVLASLLALAVPGVGVCFGVPEPAEKRVLRVSPAGLQSVPSTAFAPSPDQVAVAVIQSAPWAPNAPARDGAREFEILITAVSLAKQKPLVGLVGVGNRAGLLQPEAERALERLVWMGVPVVKVATRGTADADPENLFIEAGELSAAASETLLAECLLKFGAIPAARDPFHPTEMERAKAALVIEAYQLAFATAAQETRVAVR